MPVTGVLPGVAGDLEGLADPTGGQDYCGGLEQHEGAGLAVVAEGAGNGVAVLDQLGDGQLGEHLDPRLGIAELGQVLLLEGDDLLLEGADQLQSGAVTDVGEPWVLVPAEVALADPAVLGAVEQRAVGLELPDPVRGLLGVQLDHAGVVQELAATQGVAEVDLPAVLGVDVAHGRGNATLGHHRVGLAEQRLAQDRGFQALLTCFDRRRAVRHRRRR